MKVVTSAEMRSIEEHAAAMGISSGRLMENAGRALAVETIRSLDKPGPDIRALVIVGPGNNGGDGLVAARYLHDWGASVTVLVWRRHLDSDALFARLMQRDIEYYCPTSDEEIERTAGIVSTVDVVIDAVFGTGKKGQLENDLASLLRIVALEKKARPDLKIVAADLPSGVEADTGHADHGSLTADLTVAFGFPKPGHYLSPGAKNMGRLVVVDIGIPQDLATAVETEMIDSRWVKVHLPDRPSFANKGTFGKVLVIGGSLNYTGAPCLAAMGALRAGAGLVTVAVAKSIHQIVATKLTETTFLCLPEVEPGILGIDAIDQLNEMAVQYDVLLIGPGLGRHSATTSLVKRFILGNVSLAGQKVILDADALFALAGSPKVWRSVSANLAITPHPGEMARLVGKTVQEVESDRLGIAARSAVDWHVEVVLKGANTVIAGPQGVRYFDTHANAVLATAGTGDVLSGVIAGFAAQGLNLGDAARCGVYIHGEAGELVRNEVGDAGAIAGDLLPRIPLAIKSAKKFVPCEPS